MPTQKPVTRGAKPAVRSVPAKRKARAAPAPARRRLLLAGLAAADIAYLAALAVIANVNSQGPEQWWPAVMNLYVPQWYWALPAIALTAAHLFLARRWVFLPLAALAWVAGPQMDFHWQWYALKEPAGTKLRVMSFNAGGNRDRQGIATEIQLAEPDLVFLQEAKGTVRTLADWNVERSLQIQLASRSPLTGVEERRLRNAPAWRTFLRAQTRVGNRLVTLYNLHLSTPREGLARVREAGLGGIGAFEEQTTERLIHASGVRSDFSHEAKGPAIIAGDFNAPETSLVCRTLLGLGFRDAFTTAGSGYGYTYGHRLKLGLGQSYVRLDHILVSPEWTVLRCWTGGSGASDHRPVIADLVLPQ